MFKPPRYIQEALGRLPGSSKDAPRSPKRPYPLRPQFLPLSLLLPTATTALPRERRRDRDREPPQSMQLVELPRGGNSTSFLPRGRRRGRVHDGSESKQLVGIALLPDSAFFLLCCCTGTVAGLAAGRWITKRGITPFVMNKVATQTLTPAWHHVEVTRSSLRPRPVPRVISGPRCPVAINLSCALRPCISP